MLYREILDEGVGGKVHYHLIFIICIFVSGVFCFSIPVPNDSQFRFFENRKENRKGGALKCKMHFNLVTVEFMLPS